MDVPHGLYHIVVKVRQIAGSERVNGNKNVRNNGQVALFCSDCTYPYPSDAFIYIILYKTRKLSPERF